MAWERVNPSRGQRMGPLTQVTMMIENKAPRRKAASLTVRIIIGADIARELAFVPKDRLVLDRDPEARLLRLSKTEPGEQATSFSLMGTDHRKKVGRCGTVGLRISLYTLKIHSDRTATKAEKVSHHVEDGALIIAPPAWAWDDWIPPPAQPRETALVPATPDRPRQPAVKHPSDPPAPRVLVSLPLTVTLDRGEVAPEPTPGEQDEAESLLRSGRGALAIAEYFGWPLRGAQAYAAAFRAAQATAAKGKAA